jgi:hypothetical protein
MKEEDEESNAITGIKFLFYMAMLAFGCYLIFS